MESFRHAAATASPTVADCFALLTVDDAIARTSFAQCHAAAEARGDAALQLQCAAGMVLAIAVEYADFRGLDLWAARLRAGLPHASSVSSGIERARVDAAMAALPWLVVLPESDLANVRERAPRLLTALLESHRDASLCPPDEWMLLAKIAADFYFQEEDALALERLSAAAQEHLHSCAVSPMWHARWWLLVQMHFEYAGNAVRSQAANERVQTLMDSHGFPRMRFELACLEMAAALKAGELTQADRLFDELDRLRMDVRPGRVPHGLRAQALLLVRRGQYREAQHKVDLVLALCADAEVPRRDQGSDFVLRAHCLVALGEGRQGLAVLEAEREHQSGAAAQTVQVIIQMVEAVLALQGLAADRHTRIVDAVRAASAIDYGRFLHYVPVWAGRIAEYALDAGVETEFLRTAIRQRRLLPDDPTREDWPWRLHVQALGELRLLRDGEPVHTAGKSQRKPLELLALLAAHGGGPLSIDAVIDQLWPSLEANAPRASFDMALSRLRKLLEVPDAIRVTDGKVGLNTAVVWTDVAAFEHVWERLARLKASADAATTASEAAAPLADRALALYRDRLLGSEDASGALQSVRERLAIKFARVVVDHGARLEALGQWRVATALYERALTRDTLAEPVYRALMRAHLQLGERAEALRTFRRCRQLLAAVLGTEPSAQTQALARAAEGP